MTTETASIEQETSLWGLIAAPMIWAVHFLLCYITAAIFCAKVAADDSLAEVRIAIAVYTVVALAVVLVLGWRSCRRINASAVALDSPAGRHRFIAFATLLLSALSALAVAYAGLVAIFLRSCR